QSMAMVEALTLAGVQPDTIGYVECHGTGTAVGDPLEVQALNRAFRAFTNRAGFCAIGSVKTNIGHLEQAAGLAGLIKVALAIRQSRIPPSLNYESPNPKIPFGESPFFVNTKLLPWEGIGGRRRAAVNGLGLGGTNAFAVLESDPEEPSGEIASSNLGVQILPLSAKDDSALTELTSRIKDRLAADSDLDLADVCLTAASSRSQMPVRLAVVARTREEMVERLGLAAGGADSRGLARGKGKPQPLAFLFTGKGSQYFGMSRQLYRALPQFRQVLDRCEELFRPHVERRLLDVIFAEDGDRGQLNETGYSQPALFAVEYALAELWQSLGVTPDAVMGHSIGEFVAACVAGAMTLEDAIKLIAARARLMQRLPSGGSMASILADEEKIVQLMDALGQQPLSVAAVNAPHSVVVSGEGRAVRAFIKSLEAENIAARQLAVSHAFHSPLMEPILDELELAAQEVKFKAPAVPMVANLTGLLMEDAPTGLYWKQHARGAVQFAKGMETLAKLGCTTFLEIGPGNTLLGLGRQSLPWVKGTWLASLDPRHDEVEGFLESVCRLFVQGHAIRWKAITTLNAGRRVSLPTYPFQRQSYLLTDDAPEMRSRAKAIVATHPLLGSRLRSALKEAQFEATYGLTQFPFLDDHRVYGLPVLPTTAGLEVAIAGGMSLLDSREIELKNFVYREALLLPDEGFRIVHAIFTPEREGTFLFQILSTDATDIGSWSSHISGTLAARAPSSESDKYLSIQDLVARQTREIPADQYYEAIAQLGLNYGPSFRGIQALWCGKGEALSRVRIPDSLAIEGFELHPALLDACLHIYPALVEEYGDFTALPEGQRRTFLPISLERVRFLIRDLREVWVHAVRRIEPEGNPETMTIDLRVLNSEGRAVAVLDGLSLKRLAPEDLVAGGADAIESWLYQTSWVLRPPLAPATSSNNSPSRWLIFADDEGVAVELAGRLQGLAQQCQLVYPDQSQDENARERMIDELVDSALVSGHNCRAVVYLWGLNAGRISSMTPEWLARSERLVVGGALALVRALSRAGENSQSVPRLWFVTRNSQMASSDSPPSEPLPAMLWGLGRTVTAEYPRFWGGLVDLAANEGSSEVQTDALLRELWNSDNDRQVAIRPAGRLVARFVRLPRGPNNEARLFRGEATYLISGGLGSLGLKVAQWMVARGARVLVLTTRRGAQGKAAVAVRELEAQGVRAVVAVCDITRETEIGRILSEIRATMPPLRGVFHCAGMLDDGILDQMNWDRFSAVTAPKMIGGWLLHRATLGDELDHFVLFSSILSLMGSPGQSNYTAANAFLDALAGHRQAAGLPAVTLNWGPWAESGLATASGNRGEAIWKTRGTRYIPPDHGIEV
ncbi:MAG: SDR family NAD(P)-dependent oxidoreductase, partial [Planctomycetaceae bacterium]|nr:SDR family NAD(P)-dependent oxidoreductase [Planctomycetaceae bacterium]